MKKEDKWIVFFIIVAAIDATLTAIGVMNTSIFTEKDPLAVWFYNLFDVYGFYIFGIVNTILFALLIKKSRKISDFMARNEHNYVFILVAYTVYTGLTWGRVIFLSRTI